MFFLFVNHEKMRLIKNIYIIQRIIWKRWVQLLKTFLQTIYLYYENHYYNIKTEDCSRYVNTIQFNF